MIYPLTASKVRMYSSTLRAFSCSQIMILLQKVQFFYFRHSGPDPESSEFNAFARTGFRVRHAGLDPVPE